VTLVEFGDGVHGQAPSSGSAIGVRYRVGARYSSVLLQQGRVVLDADGGEAPPVIACGIYRATVVENADPLVRDDRNCLPQPSPGAPGTWPNRLAGMYPDNEIARRLNVSTRTVQRHRTRNQPPAYSAVTSADPTRQRHNHHERHFKTMSKRRCRAARVVVTALADPVKPTRRQAERRTLPLNAERRSCGRRGPFPVQGRLRHPATVHR